jgi:hypothetical protein
VETAELLYVNTREKLLLAISELRSHPVIGIDVEAHAFRYLFAQGFRSRSGLDPDSIRSVDPDPDPYLESGSGSRTPKITRKSRKNL